MSWFDEKFNEDVTRNLLYEKLEKRYATSSAPDMHLVRAGLNNIKDHLDYICSLLDDRQWLAGDELSFADGAAAGHLSSIDYLGDVPWHDFQTAKVWYTRLKSRPSFRPLLSDRVPGMPPPRYYSDLDF
jgi:glutathione S-transferase